MPDEPKLQPRGVPLKIEQYVELNGDQVVIRAKDLGKMVETSAIEIKPFVEAVNAE